MNEPLTPAPEPLKRPNAQASLESALPNAIGEENATPIRKLAPMDYQVRIPTFEGPLDLLLHLIRKEQIDIYDIPITFICKKYLEYLGVMREFDVNIAGEFLVMASTLMVIKSQTLLPVENNEEEEEEDLRIPLVAQLLELQRYREASEELDKRDWLERDIYVRPESAIWSIIPKEAMHDGPIDPIDNYKLLLAFKSALDRTAKPKVAITAPVTNIKETVQSVTRSLTLKEVQDFKDLVPQNEDHPRKRRIIMTFLAMLELARLKFIEITQLEPLGPVQIKRVRSFDELDVSLLEQF